MTKKYQNLILEKFEEFNLSTVDQNQRKVLDLGANLGHFTSACIKFGYEVVAVEPHPVALKHLRKRFKHSKKVKIIPKAVGDAYGTIQLYLHPDHLKDPLATSISASIIPDKFTRHSKVINVPIIKISDLFSDGTVFELVKIDIEGAEMFLIPDLIKYSNQIKRLLVETHERFMVPSIAAQSYKANLNILYEFIEKNSLTRDWHVDWI